MVKKIFIVIGIVVGAVGAFTGAVLGIMAAQGKFKTPVIYPDAIVLPDTIEVTRDNKLHSFLVEGTTNEERGVTMRDCELEITKGAQYITLCDANGKPLVASETDARMYPILVNQRVYFKINNLDSLIDSSDSIGKLYSVISVRSTYDEHQPPTNDLTINIDIPVDYVGIHDLTQSVGYDKSGGYRQTIAVELGNSKEITYDFYPVVSRKPFAKDEKLAVLYYDKDGKYIEINPANVATYNDHGWRLSDLFEYENGVLKFKAQDRVSTHPLLLVTFATYAQKEEFEASHPDATVLDKKAFAGTTYTQIDLAAIDSQVESVSVSSFVLDLYKDNYISVYSASDNVTYDDKKYPNVTFINLQLLDGESRRVTSYLSTIDVGNEETVTRVGAYLRLGSVGTNFTGAKEGDYIIERVDDGLFRIVPINGELVGANLNLEVIINGKDGDKQTAYSQVNVLEVGPVNKIGDIIGSNRTIDFNITYDGEKKEWTTMAKDLIGDVFASAFEASYDQFLLVTKDNNVFKTAGEFTYNSETYYIIGSIVDSNGKKVFNNKVELASADVLTSDKDVYLLQLELAYGKTINDIIVTDPDTGAVYVEVIQSQDNPGDDNDIIGNIHYLYANTGKKIKVVGNYVFNISNNPHAKAANTNYEVFEGQTGIEIGYAHPKFISALQAKYGSRVHLVARTSNQLVVVNNLVVYNNEKLGFDASAKGTADLYLVIDGEGGIEYLVTSVEVKDPFPVELDLSSLTADPDDEIKAKTDVLSSGEITICLTGADFAEDITYDDITSKIASIIGTFDIEHNGHNWDSFGFSITSTDYEIYRITTDPDLRSGAVAVGDAVLTIRIVLKNTGYYKDYRLRVHIEAEGYTYHVESTSTDQNSYYLRAYRLDDDIEDYYFQHNGGDLNEFLGQYSKLVVFNSPDFKVFHSYTMSYLESKSLTNITHDVNFEEVNANTVKYNGSTYRDDKNDGVEAYIRTTEEGAPGYITKVGEDYYFHTYLFRIYGGEEDSYWGFERIALKKQRFDIDVKIVTKAFETERFTISFTVTDGAEFNAEDWGERTIYKGTKVLLLQTTTKANKDSIHSMIKYISEDDPATLNLVLTIKRLEGADWVNAVKDTDYEITGDYYIFNTTGTYRFEIESDGVKLATFVNFNVVDNVVAEDNSLTIVDVDPDDEPDGETKCRLMNSNTKIRAYSAYWGDYVDYLQSSDNNRIYENEDDSIEYLAYIDGKVYRYHYMTGNDESTDLSNYFTLKYYDTSVDYGSTAGGYGEASEEFNVAPANTPYPVLTMTDGEDYSSDTDTYGKFTAPHIIDVDTRQEILTLDLVDSTARVLASMVAVVNNQYVIDIDTSIMSGKEYVLTVEDAIQAVDLTGATISVKFESEDGETTYGFNTAYGAGELRVTLAKYIEETVEGTLAVRIELDSGLKLSRDIAVTLDPYMYEDEVNDIYSYVQIPDLLDELYDVDLGDTRILDVQLTKLSLDGDDCTPASQTDKHKNLTLGSFADETAVFTAEFYVKYDESQTGGTISAKVIRQFIVKNSQKIDLLFPYDDLELTEADGKGYIGGYESVRFNMNTPAVIDFGNDPLVKRVTVSNLVAGVDADLDFSIRVEKVYTNSRYFSAAVDGKKLILSLSEDSFNNTFVLVKIISATGREALYMVRAAKAVDESDYTYGITTQPDGTKYTDILQAAMPNTDVRTRYYYLLDAKTLDEHGNYISLDGTDLPYRKKVGDTKLTKYHRLTDEILPTSFDRYYTLTFRVYYAAGYPVSTITLILQPNNLTSERGTIVKINNKFYDKADLSVELTDITFYNGYLIHDDKAYFYNEDTNEYVYGYIPNEVDNGEYTYYVHPTEEWLIYPYTVPVSGVGSQLHGFLLEKNGDWVDSNSIEYGFSFGHAAPMSNYAHLFKYYSTETKFMVIYESTSKVNCYYKVIYHRLPFSTNDVNDNVTVGRFDTPTEAFSNTYDLTTFLNTYDFDLTNGDHILVNGIDLTNNVAEYDNATKKLTFRQESYEQTHILVFQFSRWLDSNGQPMTKSITFTVKPSYYIPASSDFSTETTPVLAKEYETDPAYKYLDTKGSKIEVKYEYDATKKIHKWILSFASKSVTLYSSQKRDLVYRIETYGDTSYVLTAAQTFTGTNTIYLAHTNEAVKVLLTFMLEGVDQAISIYVQPAITFFDLELNYPMETEYTDDYESVAYENYVNGWTSDNLHNYLLNDSIPLGYRVMLSYYDGDVLKYHNAAQIGTKDKDNPNYLVFTAVDHISYVVLASGVCQATFSNDAYDPILADPAIILRRAADQEQYAKVYHVHIMRSMEDNDGVDPTNNGVNSEFEWEYHYSKDREVDVSTSIGMSMYERIYNGYTYTMDADTQHYYSQLDNMGYLYTDDGGSTFDYVYEPKWIKENDGTRALTFGELVFRDDNNTGRFTTNKSSDGYITRTIKYLSYALTNQVDEDVVTINLGRLNDTYYMPEGEIAATITDLSGNPISLDYSLTISNDHMLILELTNKPVGGWLDMYFKMTVRGSSGYLLGDGTGGTTIALFFTAPPINITDLYARQTFYILPAEAINNGYSVEYVTASYTQNYNSNTVGQTNLDKDNAVFLFNPDDTGLKAKDVGEKATVTLKVLVKKDNFIISTVERTFFINVNYRLVFNNDEDLKMDRNNGSLEYQLSHNDAYFLNPENLMLRVTDVDSNIQDISINVRLITGGDIDVIALIREQSDFITSPTMLDGKYVIKNGKATLQSGYNTLVTISNYHENVAPDLSIWCSLVCNGLEYIKAPGSAYYYSTGDQFGYIDYPGTGADAAYIVDNSIYLEFEYDYTGYLDLVFTIQTDNVPYVERVRIKCTGNLHQSKAGDSIYTNNYETYWSNSGGNSLESGTEVSIISAGSPLNGGMMMNDIGGVLGLDYPDGAYTGMTLEYCILPLQDIDTKLRDNPKRFFNPDDTNTTEFYWVYIPSGTSDGLIIKDQNGEYWFKGANMVKITGDPTLESRLIVVDGHIINFDTKVYTCRQIRVRLAAVPEDNTNYYVIYHITYRYLNCEPTEYYIAYEVINSSKIEANTALQSFNMDTQYLRIISDDVNVNNTLLKLQSGANMDKFQTVIDSITGIKLANIDGKYLSIDGSIVTFVDDKYQDPMHRFTITRLGNGKYDIEINRDQLTLNPELYTVIEAFKYTEDITTTKLNKLLNISDIDKVEYGDPAGVFNSMIDIQADYSIKVKRSDAEAYFAAHGLGSMTIPIKVTYLTSEIATFNLVITNDKKLNAEIDVNVYSIDMANIFSSPNGIQVLNEMICDVQLMSNSSILYQRQEFGFYTLNAIKSKDSIKISKMFNIDEIAGQIYDDITIIGVYYGQDLIDLVDNASNAYTDGTAITTVRPRGLSTDKYNVLLVQYYDATVSGIYLLYKEFYVIQPVSGVTVYYANYSYNSTFFGGDRFALDPTKTYQEVAYSYVELTTDGYGMFNYNVVNDSVQLSNDDIYVYKTMYPNKDVYKEDVLALTDWLTDWLYVTVGVKINGNDDIDKLDMDMQAADTILLNDIQGRFMVNNVIEKVEYATDALNDYNNMINISDDGSYKITLNYNEIATHFAKHPGSTVSVPLKASILGKGKFTFNLVISNQYINAAEEVRVSDIISAFGLDGVVKVEFVDEFDSTSSMISIDPSTYKMTLDHTAKVSYFSYNSGLSEAIIPLVATLSDSTQFYFSIVVVNNDMAMTGNIDMSTIATALNITNVTKIEYLDKSSTTNILVDIDSTTFKLTRNEANIASYFTNNPLDNTVVVKFKVTASGREVEFNAVIERSSSSYDG